mgnify:CR=1 FL=1
MKRRDLIKKLESAGYKLARNGNEHDVYLNPATGKQAVVPRHREINELTAKTILKKAGI